MKKLEERVGIALKDFTSGRASMHVPPLDTDVDIVLAECIKTIIELQDRAEKAEAQLSLPTFALPPEMFMSDAVKANLSTDFMDGANWMREEVLRRQNDAT